MPSLALLAVFGLALLIAVVVTALLRAMASRLGRLPVRGHPGSPPESPIPGAGGFAVFLAFVASSALALRLDGPSLALVGTGAVVLLAGLARDWGRSARWTELGVPAASVAHVALGGGIEADTQAPLLGATLSIAWLLGVTYAAYRLGFRNRLAAGAAAVTAMLLFGLAVSREDAPMAVLTAALSGACAGLLLHSRAPARARLGHSGRLVLGYLLAGLALRVV